MAVVFASVAMRRTGSICCGTGGTDRVSKGLGRVMLLAADDAADLKMVMVQKAGDGVRTTATTTGSDSVSVEETLQRMHTMGEVQEGPEEEEAMEVDMRKTSVLRTPAVEDGKTAGAEIEVAETGNLGTPVWPYSCSFPSRIRSA